ncbi:MAG: fibronectin type III domain-containing protein [Limisphaerales bacterium]
MRLILLILGLLAGGGMVWAQAYNWKPVVINGGGYVDGIVFHPNAPGLMYCRTDIGGAYRWNPTTTSWTQLLNFVGYPNNQGSLMGVESIGLDPQDTNRLYLACGWMGGSNPSGIMISTNQGASFTVISSPWVIESNNDGRGSGERFGVDPNLGSILFYGTHLAGLWKSANYAANWSQVTSFPVSTTANGVGIVFVEFIKSSGSPGSATPVIWVGVSQGGTNLFRSTDGGSTWTGINTNGVPPGYMPHHAAQDGLGNMYITFCDAPGPNGVSYGAVRKFNLTTLTSINVTPPTGQGGFGGVTVDAENPNTVAVSTIDCWWPQNYIYRSTNGGTNWTQTYAGNTDCSSAPWMGVGASGPIVQGWSDDLKIDPFNSDHLFWTSGGGVFSSFNFTAAQPSWEFQSVGIEEMVYCRTGTGLASPPSGPQLFSAFGDIAGFAHYNLDVSPPATNYFTGGGNNYIIDFAELNPNLVVRTYYNDSGRSGYFSTNAGSTWTTFATEPAAAATNGPGVVVISADGSRLVWAIPGSPSFYSTNNGATWTQCAGSNPTPPNSWEQPYPFSDRVNSNKFYIYMPDSGVVYVSTNGGASFFAGATLTAWADSMRTTFSREGNVWVALYNGLWCSTNSAASFFQVPGVQAAHAIGFGKSKSSGGYPAIYLHGEINNTWGVYRSDDQAATWTRINDDQHQYGGIQQVIGDPKIYGRCYIGALGIVYGDLPNQPPFTPTGLTATASNAAVSLTWNTAVGADSYMVGRSTITGGPYTNIASGVTATTYLDTGLVNGTTYYYVVAATNVYGSSSNSIEASATPAPSVPSPWQTQDIGAVGITGSSLYANGVFTVAGAGGDIQGTADAFRFDYVTTTGNCTIIARVVSVQNIDPWSKAGVMIRQSLDAGAANAFIAVTPGNGVTWQYRSSAGGGTSWNQTTGLNAPYWIRLVRSGSTFTGYRSPDGVTWTPQGTNTFTMTSTVYVGLALTSHNSSSLCTATFDNVTVPGWPTPPAAPTGLTATAGDGSVALSWSASATATNYYIKSSLTSGSGYTTIATNASLAFTNNSLNNGTLYYFVVSAVNAAGESPNSAEVSARPTSSAPVAISATNVAGQLGLAWPVDHTGWQLQSQTNSLAVGLSTNWVNVTGSTQTNLVAMPVNPTNEAVFFRLVRP